MAQLSTSIAGAVPRKRRLSPTVPGAAAQWRSRLSAWDRVALLTAVGLLAGLLLGAEWREGRRRRECQRHYWREHEPSLSRRGWP